MPPRRRAALIVGDAVSHVLAKIPQDVIRRVRQMCEAVPDHLAGLVPAHLDY